VLKVNALTATQIYHALCQEGYIKPVDSSEMPGEEVLWHNITKGNGLAHATARKPIKRKTAEELVQKKLSRRYPHSPEVYCRDNFYGLVE